MKVRVKFFRTNKRVTNLNTQLAKVAVLLSLGSDAVSVKNTPPLNEIYEEVLRNKFESRDNKERLLLEVADLGDELQGS